MNLQPTQQCQQTEHQYQAHDDEHPDWETLHRNERDDPKRHIRSWIDQIKHRVAAEPSKPRDDKLNVPIETYWRPHNLPLGHDHLQDAKLRGPRYHRASRDSPLQSLPSNSYAYGQHLVTSPSRSQQEKPGLDDEPWRQDDHLDSDGSVEDAYTRRPRRKTRHNRYDHHKVREKQKTSGKRVPPRPRSRRKGVINRKLTSGKEIMSNFTSTSLGDGRVTIKPNFTAGLFTNGRASATETADLAFNDMVFVRRDKREAEAEARSNLRQIEKRKRSREVSNESDFFDDLLEHSHKKALRASNPSREVSLDQPGSREGPIAVTEPNVRKAQHRNKENVLHFKVKIPKPDRGAPSPLSRASSSGTETSWSPRCHSSRAASTSRAKQTSASPMPESCLKKLIETGIFDFLGPAEREAIASFSTEQDNSSGLIENPVTNQPRDNARRPAIYEDKAVMVSPWSTRGTMTRRSEVRQFQEQGLGEFEGDHPILMRPITCTHIQCSEAQDQNNNMEGSLHFCNTEVNDTIQEQASQSYRKPSVVVANLVSCEESRPISTHLQPALDKYAERKLLPSHQSLRLPLSPSTLLEQSRTRPGDHLESQPRTQCTDKTSYEQDMSTGYRATAPHYIGPQYERPSEDITQYIESLEREILGGHEHTSTYHDILEPCVGVEEFAIEGHHQYNDTSYEDQELWPLEQSDEAFQRISHGDFGSPATHSNMCNVQVEDELEMITFWRPNFLML